MEGWVVERKLKWKSRHNARKHCLKKCVPCGRHSSIKVSRLNLNPPWWRLRWMPSLRWTRRRILFNSTLRQSRSLAIRLWRLLVSRCICYCLSIFARVITSVSRTLVSLGPLPEPHTRWGPSPVCVRTGKSFPSRSRSRGRGWVSG